MLKLDPYRFPISKDKIKKCPQIGVFEYRCSINQTYNVVGTFYRKNSDDVLRKTVKESTTKGFTCYVDATPASVDKCEEPKLCLMYRNVDPSALFPQGVAVRKNWQSSEGITARAQIENTANKIGIDQSLIDYRITLNPTQIKNIKEYNRDQQYYYSEEDVEKCNPIPDSHYIGCKSLFLNKLRDNNETYGSLLIDTYGKKKD